MRQDPVGFLTSAGGTKVGRERRGGADELARIILIEREQLFGGTERGVVIPYIFVEAPALRKQAAEQRHRVIAVGPKVGGLRKVPLDDLTRIRSSAIIERDVWGHVPGGECLLDEA